MAAKTLLIHWSIIKPSLTPLNLPMFSLTNTIKTGDIFVTDWLRWCWVQPNTIKTLQSSRPPAGLWQTTALAGTSVVSILTMFRPPPGCPAKLRPRRTRARFPPLDGSCCQHWSKIRLIQLCRRLSLSSLNLLYSYLQQYIRKLFIFIAVFNIIFNN